MTTRFATWLVKAREERRWSRRDLARFLHCDTSLVFRWENGEGYPLLPRFAALIVVLAADANEVLRLIPPSSTDNDNASAA